MTNQCLIAAYKEHHTIKQSKANWIGHSLRRNCFVKHVIEEKIEVTGKRGIRCKQLLDDIKETRGTGNSKSKN